MRQVIIATKNKGKAADFKVLFKKYNIEAISLLELDKKVPDVEETGSSFQENAALKAEQIADLLQTPVLADDSGLVIDAIDGRPGIFSARYAGDEKDDQANIKKVLVELNTIPAENRTARFVCVLALAMPGKETIFRTGYCEGMISMQQKGENGFGYDPIFSPAGYDKTMAELSAKEKNNISHRRNAIIQLEDWLKNME